MKNALATILIAALAGANAGTALADELDWTVKVGAHEVDPKSNNGSLAGGALQAEVGSNARPTITGEYLFAPGWGIEALAAIPFEHDVKLNGVKAATVKHLPPTVSVQYHFNANGTVSPFVGVGLNYTTFFSEHTTGPLTGTKLDLNDTFGPTVHAGIDFRINERWLFALDARWIDISPDAKVNGQKVGTVHIDPFVYGFSFGYRF
ncbi:MAG TPA: OmpW family outer membrane protein [Rudaea sp.]